MDGTLSIIWHLFAARAYYVDVFLATRDIRAFWEYLYHRVSAIRTITLLICIIEKAIKENKGKDLWEKLNTHCKEIKQSTYKNLPDSIFQESTPFLWYAWVLGIFDPIKQDVGANLEQLTDLVQLARHFKILRKNSLNTLLMAITKNKLLFRVEAAPDSVLAWSRQFLDSEIGNMKKIRGYSFDEPKDSVNIEETIKKLEQLFRRLESQALCSKMDYKTILKDCCGLEPANNDEARDFKNKKNKFGSLIDELVSGSEKLDATKSELNDLFNIALCLVEPCDQQAQELTNFILDKLKKIVTKSKQDAVIKWAKKSMLRAYELDCRAQFKGWTFWQPLLERENPYFENNVEAQNALKTAERHSVLYENLLRETTETNHDDVKNRSTAFTIRARALYLQGYFPQAHHFIDLASAGLFPERIEHWSLISVVHIVRAELLAISAHEHYFSCKTAWKNDQGIGENSVVNCPPRYVS